MKTSTAITIEDLISHFGSQTKLARRLGIRPQSVQEWVATGHLPPRRAIQIAKLTMGEIPLDDLLMLTGVKDL